MVRFTPEYERKFVFTRKIGEKLKNGFYLDSILDGTMVGQIRDDLLLKEIPTRKMAFERRVNSFTNTGLCFQGPKREGPWFNKVWSQWTWGVVEDAAYLSETGLEEGDKIRIILVPLPDNKIKIIIKWVPEE